MNNLPLNQPYLIACVICRDTRNYLWAKALLNHFAEVYIIASNSDYRKFHNGDTEGVIIPESKLPTFVDAIFFHSSDELLWRSCNVNSQHIFEFNTPGTPEVKEGILPILRPTAPDFLIQLKDIEEIADYVTGKSLKLPLICCKTLELLPALSLLSQTYLAVYSQQEKVWHPSWWLNGLGISEYSQKQADYLMSLLDSEWQITRRNNSDKQNVATLIHQIASSTTSEKRITLNMVVEAAQALNTQLCLQPIDSFLSKIKSQFSSILAFKGSLTSVATATIISTLINIPTLFFDENEHLYNWKTFKKSVIIMTESQLAYLPMLRLENFSGAVLVLTSTPFSLLKQQYRVLRFGYGSHDSLGNYWLLPDLLNKIAELVPLEPENFKLLHKELQAMQKIRNNQITSCIENIQYLKDLRYQDNQKIKEIEKAVEQWRSDARVACHTVVKIGDESQQLQQHFQTALNNISIQDNEQRYQAISRLEEAFNHLKDLLQSTGEKFISSY
ncbi:hypothetical protein [Nostoc sp. NMS8]|uniref:hypothetical protein n=1 Tax=Nostoc sp. NMS8 TaxID=2815392 RepID=UPI0025DF4717|nr:hypothetical protein [Nostoc sp. NMS8]MBN3957452.1 hypothetical protein [Nostoc sp. NMS8]